MLVVTVRFSTRPERAQDFLARVKRQASDSVALENDCHHFDVAVNPADPTDFFLYEIYTDEEAFQAHLASAHFLSFQADTQGWHGGGAVTRWDGPLS